MNDVIKFKYSPSTEVYYNNKDTINPGDINFINTSKGLVINKGGGCSTYRNDPIIDHEFIDKIFKKSTAILKPNRGTKYGITPNVQKIYLGIFYYIRYSEELNRPSSISIVHYNGINTYTAGDSIVITNTTSNIKTLMWWGYKEDFFLRPNQTITFALKDLTPAFSDLDKKTKKKWVTMLCVEENFQSNIPHIYYITQNEDSLTWTYEQTPVIITKNLKYRGTANGIEYIGTTPSLVLNTDSVAEVVYKIKSYLYKLSKLIGYRYHFYIKFRKNYSIPETEVIPRIRYISSFKFHRMLLSPYKKWFWTPVGRDHAMKSEDMLGEILNFYAKYAKKWISKENEVYKWNLSGRIRYKRSSDTEVAHKYKRISYIECLIAREIDNSIIVDNYSFRFRLQINNGIWNIL